ncbi:MAG: NADH:flavin oxidoreductase/NADH oxidase [Acidimicrobiaceae bacterium]|nr:NADH:flavin oxidoreductase/NADH oxidase [Acidimicrobiaceae bacterium]
MTQLFSPLTIRSSTFPNRAWVSPMCQYSADDGVVGPWHLVHLGSFATGGAGLIMAEATAVSPEGRISVACPGLWNDEQVAAWRTVTDFIHSQDTKVGIQLAHAGRKASTMRPWDDHPIAEVQDGGWQSVAPSAVAFEGYPVPRALKSQEIDALVEDFADAAQRASNAGFDVLEIHAAHGYLLHQFLSPLSNLRDDEYGGSLENRARFLVRVVTAVRDRVGDEVPIFVRISASDYTPAGWDIEESVELSAMLRDVGVDLIDVSSGGNVAGATIPVGPGYQVHFSREIREKVRILTASVGLITDPAQAEQILKDGSADAVLLARAFLRNPRWALAAAEALDEVIAWPLQFDRARTVRHN